MRIGMNHYNETIRFAGQELEKYLAKMGNTPDSCGSGITLGLYGDFADWQAETGPEAAQALAEVSGLLWAMEDQIQPVFDVHQFVKKYRAVVNMLKQ